MNKTTCGARSRQTGEPCKLPPAKGATRCRFHGGATPKSKAKAKERLAEAAAAKAMQTYGAPVEVDPVTALLGEVHRTAGHVAWLGERIRELQSSELVWSKTKEVDKTATENPGVDTTESAVPHAWLQLYRAERKHLIDVTKTAIAAGIEERRVRLAESQGTMLATVIRAILDDLHLSAEQRAMVPDVVPRHLRAVA